MKFRRWQFILTLACLSSVALKASDKTVISAYCMNKIEKWSLTVMNGNDTVENVRLNSNVILQEESGVTYSLSLTCDGQRAYYFILFPSIKFSQDTVLIGVSIDSLSCNKSEVISYSKLILGSRMHLFDYRNSTDDSIGAKSVIDSARALIQNLPEIYYAESGDSILFEYISEQVVNPTLTFIESLQCRTMILLDTRNKDQSVTNYVDDTLQKRAIQGCGSLNYIPNKAMPLDAYYLCQAITSIVLEQSVRQLKKFKTDNGIESPTLIEIAKKLEIAFGIHIGCEIAGIIVYELSHHVDKQGTPHSCSDPLFSLVKQMIVSESSLQCYRVAIENESLCNVYENRFMTSVIGVGRDGNKKEIALSVDSIYVLHYWGTWCSPCVQQHKEVEAVSDLLSNAGVKMIHLAYEKQDRFQKWLDFIDDTPQENLFVRSDNDSINIVNEYRVQTFPSFILVGRDNKIVERVYDVTKLTDRVNTLIMR